MPAPRLLQNVARALSPAELSPRAAEAAASASTTTGSLLKEQWTNPSDVLSVLLIIGGDIVQKALAETSGGLFTPVCFSFGWVAYSFTALVNILGDGRLLPEPDYPVKVFNLGNGYVRENKHWVIGRIGRDNETKMTRDTPLEGNALRISVFEAAKCTTDASVSGTGKVRVLSMVCMVLQFGIAAIPIGIWGEWGVMMMTGAGTLGALVAGALPQWKAEKLPSKRDSKKNFAISAGNGSRDIMVILGRGHCLDLEELATQESPRSTRIWEKIDFLSDQVYNDDGTKKTHGNAVKYRTAKMLFGIPLGFLMTGALCTTQCVFWIALLITVAGLKSHSWFILAVGALGMFQNAIVAAISRDPSKRNLPLIEVDQIITRTVMDGLMDLEITFPGQALALRDEFFPGKLREEEQEWWDGRKERYDEKRHKEHERRGIPRSRYPKYNNSNNKFRSSDDNRSEDLSSDGPLLVTETSSLAASRARPRVDMLEFMSPASRIRTDTPREEGQEKAPLPPSTTPAPKETTTFVPPHPRSDKPSEKSSTPSASASPPENTASTTDNIPSHPPLTPQEPPNLPPPITESPTSTKSFATKPPSPKKAKGPVTFADTTGTETHDFGQPHAHDFAQPSHSKQPARSMTHPETASPKEQGERASASLSVDEIYKIVQSPDWS